MKKLFTFYIATFLSAIVLAQSPEKISYQAVIRDADNNLVTNQSVGMQISILLDSADGQAVYVETQTPGTNANGLVSMQIGNGTVVSGDFTDIDWAKGQYFLKTDTDPEGGSNYSITGISQLLSVPYALYAKSAGNVNNNLSLNYPDGFTGAQTLVYENSTTNEYTVPAGKNLYIQAAQREFIVNSDTINDSYPRHMILGAGDIIRGESNTGVVAGFLVDSKVEPLTLDISDNEYTIPDSKTFVLLYVAGKGWMGAEFMINDIEMNPNGSSDYDYLPLILESGTRLSGNSVINGYFLK